MTTRTRMFTIGHGSRSVQEFISILEKCGVRIVVDVRSNPISVRYPWFERYALKRDLEDCEIGYRWIRGLGGKRESTLDGPTEQTGLEDTELRKYAVELSSPTMRQALQEVEGLCLSTCVALMCSEKDPYRCHRSLLADVLTLRDFEVVHLIDEKQEHLHVLNENIEVLDGRIVYRKRQLELL